MNRKAQHTENKSTRIAITGIAAISSLGVDLESIWDAAYHQRTNIVKERFLCGGKVKNYYFHRAKDLNIRACINSESIDSAMPWRSHQTDEDILWAVAVAQLALRDCNLQYDPEDNDISLFVAHENPGLESLFEKSVQESYRSLKARNNVDSLLSRRTLFNEHMYRRCEIHGYNAQTFVYLYTIGKALNTHGFASFIANACASGIYAIEAAAREIRNGTSSSAIVIALDHPRYLYKFLWFEQFGFYAPDGLIKPFDRRRDGFCLGDGAAALILEDMEQAKKRGAKIYAEYLGAGFGSQSWKITVPDVTSRTYERTISQALSRAGLVPSDIDLINVHGVGTKAGDAYEANAITKIFGQPQQQPLITALKPLTGHTLGGSALVETVLILLCMRHKIVLGTLNYEYPDPKLNLRIVTEPTSKKLQHVMKIASGFAGFDAAVIFRSA